MAKTKKTKTEAMINRRASNDRRAESERRQKAEPVAKERRQDARRKVQRRRQIDPTTCERDYTDEEIEFMQALDEYKRANGRMFPTCSEILEVVRAMGYVRMPAEEASEVTQSETLAATASVASDMAIEQEVDGQQA